VHKGVVTINFVGGDGESMQFANDWYDVLVQSGWTITSQPNAVVSPDAVVGVQVTVRGNPVANEQFTIFREHPAAALTLALFETTRNVKGQREPSLLENATVLISEFSRARTIDGLISSNHTITKLQIGVTHAHPLGQIHRQSAGSRPARERTGL
jgi:hypothetical protein